MKKSVFVAALVALMSGTALGQTGSAFTYQGRVTSNGAPVSGLATVQLSLWKDAFSNNVADRIGSVQTLNNVAVSNGVFTVIANSLLEFGVNPFNGEARWLQVAVNGVAVLPGGGSTFAFFKIEEMTSGSGVQLVEVGAWSSVTASGAVVRNGQTLTISWVVPVNGAGARSFRTVLTNSSTSTTMLYWTSTLNALYLPKTY